MGRDRVTAPPPEVRATLTHDPDARPCWCVPCCDRRNRSMRRSMKATETDGHMVDPAGTGQGRWLATPIRMWRTGEPRTREDFLR